ncbi:MAG: hypothetical protein JNL45_11060 [Hyphomicrobium sp.]|nr:hypothetical protein [Hyphomicrobium sp.]
MTGIRNSFDGAEYEIQFRVKFFNRPPQWRQMTERVTARTRNDAIDCIKAKYAGGAEVRVIGCSEVHQQPALRKPLTREQLGIDRFKETPKSTYRTKPQQVYQTSPAELTPYVDADRKPSERTKRMSILFGSKHITWTDLKQQQEVDAEKAEMRAKEEAEEAERYREFVGASAKIIVFFVLLLVITSYTGGFWFVALPFALYLLWIAFINSTFS